MTLSVTPLLVYLSDYRGSTVPFLFISSIENFPFVVIHIFDLVPGASRQTDPVPLQTKTNVTQIGVTQSGPQDDQYICFLDSNHDLFCTQCGTTNDKCYKIGNQVISFMWSSESNILVGLHDSFYSIWYCPGDACSDPALLALTTVIFDTA